MLRAAFPYASAGKRNPNMSSEVKAVSGAFKDVLGRSKAKAGAVADKMQKTLKELDQALDMADELADGYAADAAELRGVLASLSNFAPKDDEPGRADGSAGA